MKKIFAFILALATASSLLSACSFGNDENMHTLYFRNISENKEVVATFFNSVTDETSEVKMKKSSQDDKTFTYSCEGDTSKFNMAYITYDGITTDKFAFNKCVSGWFKTEQAVMPYAEGCSTTYKYNSTEAEFNFCGYKKYVHIWVPDDYDANSDEKYATIYMLDGQNADFMEIPEEYSSIPEEYPINQTLNETEQVRAMTAETGYKAIIVEIDTVGQYDNESAFSRDDEMVPDIGELAAGESTGWTKKLANKFAEFMNDTVVPYIRENYNVYTDALHTSIRGASLSGLGAFYITMEYPETFGTAGAMSPSFWVYDKEAWKNYLSQKTFDENSPFLYFYTGGEKEDTGAETKMVYDVLNELDYPSEKLALHYNENGGHALPYWKAVLSEFLEAMVFQHVEVLQPASDSTSDSTE